eukprot:7256768-Pyramimonas_sp.AAC.1
MIECCEGEHAPRLPFPIAGSVIFPHVVEALRKLELTRAVQRALDRASDSDVNSKYSYNGALSLCGREGNAEGLWEPEEEEALLLSVLLLISPEDCW